MTLFGRALAALLLVAAGSAQAATTLRVGLQDDVDFLDPARSRSYTARIVMAGFCDKLIDTTPDLKFVPQLATSWAWSGDNKVLTLKLRQGVTYQDGEPFDAASVKFNLDRSRSMPESARRSEIASIDHIDVVDPETVNLVLKQPDASLIAQLTDRAGMMLAPKVTQGPDVSAHPVCAGPYKFVERVAQDRIVLERFPQYWNAGAYHFDRIVYLPIPDSTVRMENLKAGQLDIIERTAATDVKNAQADPKLTVAATPGLGDMSLIFNLSKDHPSPISGDPRIRQAFDLAIDRNALNDAVFEGRFTPSTQPFPPASFAHDDGPVPVRDVDKAKALLKAAGVTPPVKVEMMIGNATVNEQLGQVLQAMTAEAGFDVHLRATESATQLAQEAAGNFQISLLMWSGRVDPDGNIHQFITCKGSFNDAKYCNPKLDDLLNGARLVTDTAARKAKYAEALAIMRTDLPISYLYIEPRIFSMTKTLHGFVAHPDGMIRLTNLTLDP